MMGKSIGRYVTLLKLIVVTSDVVAAKSIHNYATHIIYSSLYF